MHVLQHPVRRKIKQVVANAQVPVSMYRRVEMQQKIKQNAQGFLDKKLFQDIQRSKFGSADFTAHSRRYAKPQSFAYDSRNLGQFQLGIQATNLVTCNSQQD